ncbi:formyl-CoA transferase/CoA:oxalate CoA-transferase [Arthrobacter pigmenti]|uniref:Formyl-CoA transferase/CoA:oxalate CoA-transferase n=1 Tax=Arthrobacter pigmenti TaxID=271432 RepID=A0A846RNX5_9MICC|nr:CoA transferase [Arthrobacter pigmenti]NJC21485.1 formyl-CoA transferase/CoA:oxalate CoA-transferase [Arthrobacter pigmenti]
MTARLPLEGITVLDLSHLAAGPWCTMVLADLGADVIKIERPETGDMSRQAGNIYAGDQSAVFLSLNRNKRSIALDLKHPEGRQVFFRLAEKADVVVENLRPGKAAQLGVDRASLAERNPGLVYASISAFGTSGPYVDLAGNDPIVQALSGAMSITGEEDGPPSRQGVSVPDFGAGMMAGYAILAALVGRQRDGQGSEVNLNLLDVSVFALGPRAQEYLINGEEQPRLGSAHPQFSPYQAFPCSDGRYVYIAVINDKFWRLLCSALGQPGIADDPRYTTNVGRVQHRAELAGQISALMAQHPSGQWLEVLQNAGVPCAPVNNLSEAMSDPQVLHNGLLATMEHPTLGDLPTVGLPMTFDGERPPIRKAPPLLGEHTLEILTAAGVSEEDSRKLLDSGAAALGLEPVPSHPQSIHSHKGIS